MFLSKNGVVIEKKDNQNVISQLKKELIATPIVDTSIVSGPIKSFPVYLESDKYLFIPKVFGIEKFNVSAISKGFGGKSWESDSNITFQGKLHENQKDAVETLLGTLSTKGGGILSLPTGYGKCHGKGTMIMMANGTGKPVEDVKKGDLLMGDDGTPRKVLSTTIGVDKIYTVTNHLGESFTANSDHVLALLDTRNQPVTISIKNFLKLPFTKQLKLYSFKKTKPDPVDFALAQKYLQLNDYRVDFYTDSENETTQLIHVFRSACYCVYKKSSNWFKIFPQKCCKGNIRITLKSTKDYYYGFTLSGNHLYCLQDFTVTHNTVTTINALSTLQAKTLVIVNKIPLLNQWVQEITKFLPQAKIGIVQGKKRSDGDIIIAMIHTINNVTMKEANELFKDIRVLVVDEVHNLASEIFSKNLFKICCKYTIGLSATPFRKDKCEYVFKWHLGDICYTAKAERKGKVPIIQYYKLDSEDYKVVLNQKTGRIQFSTMLNELVEMKTRNLFIIQTLVEILEKEPLRNVLILSDRRNHLVNLKKMFEEKSSVEPGLFVGGLKSCELEKAKSCQVIFATYQAFGEGVSKKELDTLLLVTPKKFVSKSDDASKPNDTGKLEQIVGRIFRKNHEERHPLIVDFQDDFSVYMSQGYQRRRFFTTHFKEKIINEKYVDLDLLDYSAVSVAFDSSHCFFNSIK